MEEFSFPALGTAWSIVIDGAPLPQETRDKIFSLVFHFEQKFSRFLPESEANQFRNAKAGEYEVSFEFADILTIADKLRTLTDGVYDPGIGALLEHSGYDKEYRLTAEREKVAKYQLPKWQLTGTTLTLEKGIVFDIGGIGKGYCIDLVADFLKEQGYQYFLVEAGGDMYATKKADGSAFHIALEWPGKPDLAFGTVALQNMGLAVSDTSRRKWEDWHHIINPHTKKPVGSIIGCTALAKNAFLADCLTSGLFLSLEENYPKLTEEFGGEFVVFKENDAVKISGRWPGEFFQEK